MAPDEASAVPWPAVAGRYVLMLELDQPACLRVRSGRAFALQPGTYAYVGSAAGPGGLAARLAGYATPRRQPHWHVDFLLAVAGLTHVLCFDLSVEECQLAAALGGLPGTAAVEGFGCSDCRCPAHLYRLEAYAEPAVLLAGLESTAPEVIRALLDQVLLR